MTAAPAVPQADYASARAAAAALPQMRGLLVSHRGQLDAERCSPLLRDDHKPLVAKNGDIRVVEGARCKANPARLTE
jgi:hypothetical protein